MRNMQELTSQKVLEQILINDDLLYVKMQDDDTTRLFITHILQPWSFQTFLINVEQIFKYPNQEEGKYMMSVADSKLIIYEPIKDENEKIVDGQVIKAYDIQKQEFIPNHMLSKSLLKNHFSEVEDNDIRFQKKLVRDNL